VEAARAPSRRRRPSKYGALALIRHGLSGRDWPRAWPDRPMRNRYDVVIIGGGVHGQHRTLRETMSTDSGRHR